MTNRQPGRPKKQDKEDRRHLILDAAIRLFAENGFEEVRIKDVAAVSGVATSLVHHHFGNRDGLRAACRDHVISEIQIALSRLEDMLAGLEAHSTSVTPDTLLDMLGLIMRDGFGQRTHLIRFLAITFMEGRSETRTLFQDYFALFHKITERMARSGHLREDIDPTWVTMYGVYVQLGTAFLFDVLNAQEGGDPYDPETSRSRTEAFIKIAKTGLFKPTG